MKNKKPPKWEAPIFTLEDTKIGRKMLYFMAICLRFFRFAATVAQDGGFFVSSRLGQTTSLLIRVPWVRIPHGSSASKSLSPLPIPDRIRVSEH